MKMKMIRLVRWGALVWMSGLLCGFASAEWYKGVTHVHSLWSDGDMAPEMIASWYKERGYNFVCFSEHSRLQEGEMFVTVDSGRRLQQAHVEAVREKFGPEWVELRLEEGRAPRMRLKTHDELSAYFNEDGKFLLVPSEEITCAVANIHTNGLNLREPIPGGQGTRAEILQGHLDAVADQMENYDVPMVAHVNHLNWSTGITSEEMIEVRGLRFFEVYNGHPGVRTWGRASRGMPSNDEHWDIIQSMRQRRDAAQPLVYGLATDDSHEYHEWSPRNVNPGRGWIMVQAEELEANALMQALIDGNFYSTTGVTLADIKRSKDSLSVSIAAEEGVSYTTQFIGTEKGFDPATAPRRDAAGAPIAGATLEYSGEVGAVLHETTANPAVYTFSGRELYVRAVVKSDKAQTNAVGADDVEMAWVQPVRTK